MAYALFPGTEKCPFYVFLQDTVTGGQLAELIEIVFSSPDWHPGSAVLWDGRYIQELLIEVEDFKQVRKLTQKLKDQRGPGRSAIVASREMDLLVAQYFRAAISNPGRELEVFNSLTSALHWLGFSELPPNMSKLRLRGPNQEELIRTLSRVSQQ